MRTTIDASGRLVLPEQLRDRLGLRPGEVEVTVHGSFLRVDPLTTDDLVEWSGRLVVPASGVVLDDVTVMELRDADRR